MGKTDFYQFHPLPITNYQLPITNYQLPITHYQLPITHYQLPITHLQNNLNVIFRNSSFKPIFRTLTVTHQGDEIF
ncbi:hypothetical protein [Mastigocoleus testarum]|uniref:hypothetical protein n=1 Tax=Mastigocoleus testarum TaxID=996925 RepID=UPI00092E86D4|nr:hypothetical protein [Mastigocoleus testarum]